MATKNIIGSEPEENQTPPATPAHIVLIQLFAAAPTPFTTIHNQLKQQEVTICELKSEVNINNSSSDIISTPPSDREPHIGLSSGGNQNKENEERTIRIAEMNLNHHHEEVAEDNIDSANDTNANKEDSEAKEEFKQRKFKQGGGRKWRGQ